MEIVLVEVAEHPFTVTVYEITAVPAEIPVTTPVLLTVATFGESVSQSPPSVAFANVEVEPTQTDVVPVIGATTGNGFTVITVDTMVTQEFSLVTSYEISVVPAVSPVTSPVSLIDATDGEALLHIPFDEFSN